MLNRRFRKVFNLFCIFLLLSGIMDLNLITSYFTSKANAQAGDVQQEYDLNYGSTGTAGWQGVYSAEQYLNPSADIPAIPAKKIKSVQLLRDGNEIGSVTEPAGKLSWTGNVSTSGTVHPVASKMNSNTKTYFAWYRYSISDSQKGWFANSEDEYGNPEQIYCESSTTETISGVQMPKYPECSANVTFGAQRTEEFRFDNGNGDVISSYLVKVKSFDNIIVEEDRPVDGPEGTKGTSEYVGSWNPISNARVVQPDTLDPDRFQIKYSQSFPAYPNGKEPASNNPAIKILAAPGARLMVYFGSFSFDILGETYKHPNQIRVTYEDNITDEPDLGSISVSPPAACIEVGSSGNFTVTFRNIGAADIIKTFKVQVKEGSTVLKSQDFSGLAKGGTGTISMPYTFSSTGTVNLTVVLDSGNVVTEEKNKTDNSKDFTFPVKTAGGCTPDPGPEVIEGDFTIEKPKIDFGQTNYFYSQGVKVTGAKNGVTCTISEVKYTANQSGLSWTWTSNSAFSISFAGPPYPGGMGGGYVDVTMKITSSCGGTKSVGPKSFEILIPSGNNPPVFQGAWFKPGTGNQQPMNKHNQIYEAPVNTYVDLGVIFDNSRNPNTPYDPEGDGIVYYWDFSGSDSAWIQSLKSTYGLWEYQETYSNLLTPPEEGYHTIKVSAVDTRGAKTSTYNVMIHIIPQNPVAVITPKTPIAACADVKVKSRRDVPEDFLDGSKSYSPMGRSITEYKWTNKKTMYINDTASPITETVLLEVKDSEGLWSLEPAKCDITVLPDAPPVAKGGVPPMGIRNQDVVISNQSYSPDGDPITSVSYRYKYDANNNGFEAGEPWVSLTGNLISATFKPAKVGKYLFELTACDGYGQCDNTSNEPVASYTLDVVNLAPEVAFKVEGGNNQPDPNPPTLFTADQILNNWQLYKTNTNTPEKKAFWTKNSKGQLTVGLGKLFESPFKAWTHEQEMSGTTYYYSGIYWQSNSGLGNNRLAPWRGIATLTTNQPIMIPYKKSSYGGSYDSRILNMSDAFDTIKPAVPESFIKANNKYLFFTQSDQGTFYRNGSEVTYKKNYLYALNKGRIPGYKHVYTTGDYGSYSMTPVWDGPNPYDFVLQPPDVNSGDSYSVPYYWDYSSTTSYYSKTTKESFDSTEYVLTDRYIYQVSKWLHWTRMYEDDYTDSDGDTQHRDVVTDPNYVYKVNVYDAFTGTKTGSFQFNGLNHPDAGSSSTAGGWPYYSKESFTNYGDELVYKLDAFSYTYWDYSTWKQVTRNIPARIKRYAVDSSLTHDAAPYNPIQPEWITWSPRYQDWNGNWWTDSPKNYSCTPQFVGERQYDDEGNSYQYMVNPCVIPPPDSSSSPTPLDTYTNMDSPAGAFLVKRDRLDNVVWKANLKGGRFDIAGMYWEDKKESNKYIMAMNPYTRQVIVKTFDEHREPQNIFPMIGRYVEAVDMDTGAVSDSTIPLGLENDKLRLNPVTGTFETGTSNCMYTMEGKCNPQPEFKDNAQIVRSDGNMYYSSSDYATDWMWGMFVGDGTMVNLYQKSYASTYGGGPARGQYYMFFAQGTPTTEPLVNSGFKLGQFVSAGDYTDVEMAYSMQMDMPMSDNKMAGFSFRMTDPRNRYAVETDGATLYLSRYVNGDRTVLQQTSWPFVEKTTYSYRVKTAGSKIEVSLGGVPIFQVEDSTFPTGKVGYFTDKSYVAFSLLSVKPVVVNNYWSSAYAIWEESSPGVGKAVVKYSDISFTDPENDPQAGQYKWKYTHTSKFLKNQGTSAYNGQTMSVGQLEFDKVGVYEIDLSAFDDPHPDYRSPATEFDGYRKESNPYKQTMTVHRRPVGKEKYVLNADGTITWTDESYDPDRYDPATGTYSTDGVNLQSTRGISEFKHWYITPNGSTVNSVLVRPQEIGTYTVGLQVKDEFGAWSEMYIQTIDTNKIAPPNDPPTLSMRIPNGSQASPTVFQTTRPYFEWNQMDTDPGTIFTDFHLQVLDQWGNMVRDYGPRDQTDSSLPFVGWTSDFDLPAGQLLQIRGKTRDGIDWSVDWSPSTWFYVNRAPSVVITTPGGSFDYPTIYDNDRNPWIYWTQTDPDPGTTFRHYEIQVLNEAGSIVHSQSGQVWQGITTAYNSWHVTDALPYAVKLQVRARVSDQYDVWSSWSDSKWLFIVPPVPAPSIDLDSDYDQRMNPDSNPVIVLDRHITVRFDSTYNFDRSLTFPFDVYSNDKAIFYPANSAISVGSVATFYMPTWNEEGSYTISSSQCMQGVCRNNTLAASVAGRIFDFRITDIGDFRYENVFRSSGSIPSGNEYFSGGRDENRAATSVLGHDTWVLPIRPGSHPTEIGTVPRNGYTFNFTFSSIGHYWDKGDGILIEPSFFFVPRSGGTSVPVDLYYDASGAMNKMIRVGSTQDMNMFGRRFMLADPLRNVPYAEMTTAASYEYNNIMTAAERTAFPWSRFLDNFMNRMTTISAGYGMEILPYKARTLLGPTSVPSGVSATAAQRSIQQWYGEYNLPIAPYILPKGTNIEDLAKLYRFGLNGSEPQFLKDGYIVLNFGIYTLRNNDQNTKILGYNAPRCDMWTVEGQINSSTDWKGRSYTYRSGDIVLFESDFSVRNDFIGASR